MSVSRYVYMYICTYTYSCVSRFTVVSLLLNGCFCAPGLGTIELGGLRFRMFHGLGPAKWVWALGLGQGVRHVDNLGFAASTTKNPFFFR